jgi:Domain of unknown function (DUF4389)
MLEAPSHPIRLVVHDDLQRSRLTVFFRLLLAIPHLLWLVLWTVIAIVVLVIAWFSTLIRGRNPDGLHDFLAGYLRYGVQIEAYVFLAANPYPAFFVGTAKPYPVDLEIAPPAPQNRWKTLFRLPLALPALLLAAAFGGGGSGRRSGAPGAPGVAAAASVLTWFAALARGTAPRGLRDLTAWSIGYDAQAYGYLFLLTDRYADTRPAAHLGRLEPPVVDERLPRLAVTDDLRRSRLTVFFRLPLAFPHLVWLAGWSVLAVCASILNWIATLIRGRVPRPLARFLCAYVRYWTHVGAFLHLTGNPFPGFVGRSGSYAVDLQITVPERQNRWKTLFRLPLAVPAAIVSGSLSALLVTCAVLGWFASLALGRMPEGLRDASAHALRYSGQLAAYVLVLTDHYPHGSPLAGEAPRGGSGPTLDWPQPGAFV